MGEVHMDGLTVTLIGSVLALLLSIIAFFLSRLIKQFDELNKTMIKIDKDLSGEVGILKNENIAIKARVQDLDPLWDRVRNVEKELAVVRGTCVVHCKSGQ